MSPWEEIRNKLNIVEVVEEFLPVKQVGNTFKIVCPFHNDKNPSLVLSPEKNLWHCFGCGAGGDLFDFIAQYQNISKKESLQYLAKKAGVDLKKYQKTAVGKNQSQEISKIDLGYKYLEWVAKVYHKILIKILPDRSNNVTQYCLERNLNLETIEIFKLGFAPTGNFLYKLALKHSLNIKLLSDLGLLKTDQKEGTISDKFKNRLIIPISDSSGKVCGFTARVVSENDTLRPKYLNSDQSEWFSKSKIWFGLNLNQKFIRQKNQVIIVEGNLDVITARQYGFKNLVASQGTAFSQQQIKLLKRLTTNLVLAFDNDQAGLIASRKLFLEATPSGFEVSKAIIPQQYKDIDEFLRNTSPKPTLKEKKVVIEIIPFIDSEIQDQLDKLKSPDIKVLSQSLDHLLRLLSVTDKLTQEHYLEKISQISGKSLSALNQRLTKLPRSVNIDFQSLTEKSTSETRVNLQNSILSGVLVSFQNLIAESLISFENKSEITINNQKFQICSKIFLLLKSYIHELEEFETFESYYYKNFEILKLIKKSTKENLAFNFEKIRQFVNSNFKTLNSEQKKYLTELNQPNLLEILKNHYE